MLNEIFRIDHGSSSALTNISRWKNVVHRGIRSIDVISTKIRLPCDVAAALRNRSDVAISFPNSQKLVDNKKCYWYDNVFRIFTLLFA